MHGRHVAPVLLAVALALAGCSGSDDDPGDDVTGETTSPGATTGGPDPTTTGGGPATTTVQPPGNESSDAEVLVFEANETEGEAPLEVLFDLDAESSDPEATWRLAFGDASEDATGAVEDLPAQVGHDYTIGGNFTALFEVMYGDGQTVNATVDVTVTVADAGAEPPETHFEFGASQGCVTETDTAAGVISCVSYNLGPNDGNGIDGWWQPLDERYWGAAVTGTISGQPSGGADSDCYFLDADHGVLADGHNGENTCAIDSVPDGTAWVLVYPWLEPADGMTLDFVLA